MASRFDDEWLTSFVVFDKKMMLASFSSNTGKECVISTVDVHSGIKNK